MVSKVQYPESTHEACEIARDLPIAVLVLNLEDDCTWTNTRWRELTGFSMDDSLGKSWHRVILEADRQWVLEEIGLARDQGREFSVDFRILGSAVQERMVHGRSAPIKDADGDACGYTLILEDTSDRVRMEHELRDALESAEEGNVAKARFLANMSHELRTPLNHILGSADLLLDSKLEAEPNQYALTIQSSGELLLRILSDVLDFSSVESGNLTIDHLPFDFRQLTHNVIAMHSFDARDANLDISVRIDEEIPQWMSGDAARVRQVLTNLLSNAIKFTTRGKIQLAVCLEDQSLDEIRIRIDVEDTGIGIPEHKLSQIFDQFTQADESHSRRYGGTGLGLALSLRLAKLMGGDLTVTSTHRVGSVFSFRLRLGLVDPMVVPPPQGAVTESDFRKVRILLVEDNEINQIIASRMLEKLGCRRVDIAANGRIAMEFLESNPVDLVLMDCQMPEMDGFEATKEIRRLYRDRPHIPIVALTANAMQGDRDVCIAAGMDDYLSKPIRTKELFEVLRRWARCNERADES